jgi:hypothetical protein
LQPPSRQLRMMHLAPAAHWISQLNPQVSSVQTEPLAQW